MKSADKYALLEAQMLRRRALGTASEETLDRILEEMDDLWRQMTEAERQDADARAAAWARFRARDDLGLRDRVVPSGGNVLARTAV